MNSPVPLSILQWNMADSPYAKKVRPNPEKRAEVLSALLGELRPSIVTLQEVSNAVLHLTKLPAYELHRGANGLATLHIRDRFYAVDKAIIRERAQTVALVTTANPTIGVNVINLHLPILHKTEADRRSFARTILQDSVQWRLRHKDKLEIISGDFNLPPYDEVIVGSTYGFCANRDRSHLKKHTGTVERGLFNAIWQVFGGNCGALGTYYYDNLPHGPWHLPDQVLLDPDLIQQASVHVRVLTKINSISLTTARTIRPEGKTFSDHFPVLVSVIPNMGADPTTV